MRLTTKDCALEIKALNDTGSFAGYASVFGNVDEGGDVIERGAFREYAKTRDGKVVVLYMHNMRDPVGKADVKEDDRGLYFEGALVLEDPIARKVHAHMKAGTLDGMSIGYDILAGGAEILKSGIRRLTAIKLWEISVVTFGMNPLARIETVKAAGAMRTVREFEEFLRDAGGFSHAKAKALASGGWSAIDAARDEPARGQAIDELCAKLDAIKFSVTL